MSDYNTYDILQLRRNDELYADRLSALEGIKRQMVDNRPGEVIIAVYTEIVEEEVSSQPAVLDGMSEITPTLPDTVEDTVESDSSVMTGTESPKTVERVLLAIAGLNKGEYQVFEGIVVDKDGNIILSEAVRKAIKDAIDKLREEIVGDTESGWESFEDIEQTIKDIIGGDDNDFNSFTDIKNYIDNAYKAGNGLDGQKVEDTTTFSVKLKSDVETQKYAVVDEEGLGLKGITSAIEAVEKKIDDFIGDTEGSVDELIDDAIEEEAKKRQEEDGKLRKSIDSVEIKQHQYLPLRYELFVDGNVKGTIDIPKDKFLKSATYDDAHHWLIFTFITEDDEPQVVNVDISELMATYVNGNGLSLTGNVFAIKLFPDEQTSKYLEVSEAGLRIVKIDEELAKKANAADVYTKTEIDNEFNKVNNHLTQIDEHLSQLDGDVIDINQNITNVQNTLNTEVNNKFIEVNKRIDQLVGDNEGSIDDMIAEEAKKRQEEDKKLQDQIDSLESASNNSQTEITNINYILDNIKLQQIYGSSLNYELIVNGTRRGEINIPKDQFLKDVKYEALAHKLVFSFVTTDSDNEIVYVELDDLVDTYKGSDSIEIDNENKINVKLYEIGETAKYLKITKYGLQLEGIDAELAKKADITYVDEQISNVESNINNFKTEVNNRFETVEGDITILQNLVNGSDGSIDERIERAIAIEKRERQEKDTEIEKIIDGIEIRQDKRDPLVYELYVNGEEKGSINIPKDKYLSDVKYDNLRHELVFYLTNHTDDVLPKQITISLEDLTDIYTATNGVQLAEGSFSIKLYDDDETNEFLSTNPLGLRLKGLNTKFATNEKVDRQYNEIIERINSMVNGDDGSIPGLIDSEIAKERAERIAADNVLQDNIDKKADKESVYDKTEIDSKFDSIQLVQDNRNKLLYTLMVNGQNSGEVEIPIDQYLKSVEYDTRNNQLVFITVNDKGNEIRTPIDLDNLSYSKGDGIDITSDNVIKVKISDDAETSQYLKFTNGALAIVGLNAIKEELAKKANSVDVYTKIEIDKKFSEIEEQVSENTVNIDILRQTIQNIEFQLDGDVDKKIADAVAKEKAERQEADNTKADKSEFEELKKTVTEDVQNLKELKSDYERFKFTPAATNTVDMLFTESTGIKQLISNVKQSQEDDNIIKIKSDGVYASVSLDYNSVLNKLTFKAGSQSKEIDLAGLNGISDVVYDERSKQLVFTIMMAGGGTKETRINIGDFVKMLVIDSTNSESPVKLTLGTDEENQQTLNATLRLSGYPDNGLQIMEDGTLYASKNASDIIATNKSYEKSNVQQILVDIFGDIDGVKGDITNVNNQVTKNTQDIENIDNRLTIIENKLISLQDQMDRIEAIWAEIGSLIDFQYYING